MVSHQGGLSSGVPLYVLLSAGTKSPRCKLRHHDCCSGGGGVCSSGGGG